MREATLYRFGRCEIDATAREVRLDGVARPLEPRPFDLLVHLISHRRRVVAKEELLETIWPRESVTSGALARAVMKARTAIGDDGEHSLIRTVPRVGYRFVARLDDESALPAPPASQRQGEVLTIALLPFENDTGDAALGWVGLGLMSLVVNELDNDARLAPVAMQSLLTAIDSARAADPGRLEPMVRQATGAKIVVRSVVSRSRTGYRLHFVASGQDLGDRSAEVYAEKPAELAARMVAALSEALFPDAPAAEPPGLVLRDPLATESFARGMEALAQHRWGQAANLFRMTLELEPNHLPARLELLRALGNTGDLEAQRLSRALLARAERDNDLMLAARVHQALGRMWLNRTEVKSAAYQLEISLRIAAGRETPDWTARTLMLQASVAIHQLDYERAGEILQEMYRLCDISGNRLLPVAGLNMEAITASARGDRERAVQLAAESVRRARELRAYMYVSDACDTAVWDLAVLGRLAEAASYGEEGFAAVQAIGDPYNLADSAPCICWVYRLARAPKAAERIVSQLPDLPDLPRPEHGWLAQGLLAACQGRHADAAAWFRRAIGRTREVEDAQQEQQTLPWLIDSLILCGQLDEAEFELEAAEQPRLAGSEDLRMQVLHSRALLAHARGRTADAQGLLARVMDARPAPLWLARACADAAWLAAEAGAIEEAACHLQQLPAVMAEHPIALATRARVRYAARDAAGALRLQRKCIEAFGAEAVPPYFERLSEHYEAAASGRVSSVDPPPPTGCLPSRL